MRKDPVFTGKVKGTLGRGKRPRIAIGFSPAQVAEINTRAEINDRSFAAEVRALITWALTTAPAIAPAA